MERKLSRKAALPTMAALQLLSSACGVSPSGYSTQTSPEKPNSSKSSPGVVIENLNANNGRFPYPFPEEYYDKINIQQGWYYQDGTPHHAIDYINGRVDHSETWKTFPVTAFATGLACANPPSREGNAVFIKHAIFYKNQNQTIYSYYGHLQDGSWGDIPECSSGQTKGVLLGEQVGLAGSSGAYEMKNGQKIPRSNWIHLHFQLNYSDGFADPYGIFGKRDQYPDIRFTNGKQCKDDALFRACFDYHDALVNRLKTAPTSIPARNNPPAATNTSQPTSRPTEKPAATATPRPTEKPVQTSNFNRMEVNRSAPLDQQAIQSVLSRWYNSLNTKQGVENSQTPAFLGAISYLKTEILERRGNSFIRVRWQTQALGNYTNTGNVYRVVVGEAEIDNLTNNVVQPKPTLTSTDSLNKITWKGQINWSYDMRFRYIVKMSDDLNLPSILSNQRFSDWQKQPQTGYRILRDGQWLRTDQNYNVIPEDKIIDSLNVGPAGAIGALLRPDCPQIEAGCAFP